VDSTIAVQDLTIKSDTAPFNNNVRLGRVSVGKQKTCPSGSTSNQCAFAQIVFPDMAMGAAQPTDKVSTSFNALFHDTTFIGPQVVDGSGTSRRTQAQTSPDADERVSAGHVDAQVELTFSDFLKDQPRCSCGSNDWVSEAGTIQVDVEQVRKTWGGAKQ
jgi:hypothetical protein